MKRFCYILLAAVLVASCGPGRFDPLKVDLDRALKHPISAREIYSEAETIPLQGPEGMAIGQETVLLDVTPDRFVLLDAGKNEILLFDGSGRFVATVGRAETILDGSVYRDETLEVLTQNAFFDYAMADGSLLAEHPFDNGGVTLKCLGRVDEDSVFMLGSKDGYTYGCGYIMGVNRFYSSAHYYSNYLTTHAYAPASEIQNSRYFRCGETVYSFLSQCGEIDQYTGSDFVGVPYEWDFGKRQPCFTNAQKTADRLYLAFELDGACAVLLYDLKSHRYKAVPQSEFPLGIIRDGCNYALARDTITRYVLR